MANIDKKEENRQLKKQLKQALRKIEKLQAEKTEKEREITELLFPDTDTEK